MTSPYAVPMYCLYLNSVMLWRTSAHAPPICTTNYKKYSVAESVDLDLELHFHSVRLLLGPVRPGVQHRPSMHFPATIQGYID